MVRSLRRVRVRVTVVDRHNYHAFLPLLYQVATAGLEPQDIAYPIRGILRRAPNAVYRMGDVIGGDLAARHVETADGDRIPYDFLVLAAGSRTETYGLAGVEEHAHFLHSVDEARAFRNHVLRTLERADWTRDPDERRRGLTFVVIGGGPTGLEIAGALAEMRRHVIPADYPGVDPEDVRIVLVEASAGLLGGMPDELGGRARNQLVDLGVEVRLGVGARRIDADGVELDDGSRIPARSVLWAAGVRGAPLGEKLGLATTRDHRVRVSASLQVPGRPEVYGIGDLVSVDGAGGLPLVAPVAIQAGRLVGRNIERALRDEPPLDFRYSDKGQLATIGRSRAVAHVLGLRFSGRLAWWIWLLYHLLKIVGFRNRAVVLVNWIYGYLTYDRGVRAIVGSAGLGRRREG